jgi:hypothetical protein
MTQGKRSGLSAAEKTDRWCCWKRGQLLHEIGRAKEIEQFLCLVRCLAEINEIAVGGKCGTCIAFIGGENYLSVAASRDMVQPQTLLSFFFRADKGELAVRRDRASTASPVFVNFVIVKFSKGAGRLTRSEYTPEVAAAISTNKITIPAAGLSLCCFATLGGGLWP